MQSFLRAFSALFLLAAFATADQAVAQDEVTLTLTPESKLWVEGTSNKNDWTVHAGQLEGTVALRGDNVSRVEVNVASGKIVSNRSTIMDRLMHGALKSSEHPTISFVLEEAAAGSPGADGSFTMDTRGKLTLAGETRDIEMKVTGQRMDDGKVRFTGTYPLTMSDYGIDPPTAMFGALRTGDDVVVHFDVVGSPSTETAAN